VLQGLGSRRAQLGVTHQEVANERLGVARDTRPLGLGEIKLRGNNLAKELRLILGPEGREATQHNVREDTGGPDVDGRVVPITQQNLGGNIVGRPTRGLQPCVRLEHVGQAKVGNLDDEAASLVARQQHILCLQVPMRHALLVQVHQSLQQLLNNTRRLRLSQPAIRNNLVKQLTTSNVLDDQVDALLILKGTLQVENVRVVQLLHNLQLAQQQSLIKT
jgi:hypothetical protein